MLIIRINGGIGNQLFLYSFYVWCKSVHEDVLIERSVYDQEKIHSGWTLNKIIADEDFEKIHSSNRNMDFDYTFSNFKWWFKRKCTK